MNATSPWYVAVNDTSVGPVAADLVIRGIEHRKIPPEALVCQVGASGWSPLASVEAFHSAVIRSYPPPPPDSEDARYWLEHGFRFPAPAALPRFDDSGPLAAPVFKSVLPPPVPPPRRTLPPVAALPLVRPPPISPRPVAPPVAALPVITPLPIAAPPAVAAPLAVDTPLPDPRPRVSSADIVVDMDFDAVLDAPPVDLDIDAVLDAPPVDLEIDAVLDPPPLDWSHRFQSYFLVGEAVELPEEEALLASLASAPRDTFQHDEALWNLALCMAFGSDAVGEAAARAFYDVVLQHGSVDRLEWMSRTLLGSGFVPSGIPTEAGQVAYRRLQSLCPPSLSERPPPPPV